MINKIIRSGKPEFNKIPLRKDEQITLYPNIKKSNQLLNWKPKISFLAGIKKQLSTINNLLNKKIKSIK